MWRHIGSYSSGGYSPASHRADLCSLPEQSLWDLWWTPYNWRDERFGFRLSVSTHTWSLFIPLPSGTVQSVRGLATGWMVRVSNPGGSVFLRARPDRPCVTSSHIYKANRLSAGVKRPGREAEHPPSSKAKVKVVAFAMSVRILQVQTRDQLRDSS